MNKHSELIKTLQIWVSNPNQEDECNVPSVIPCTGIVCKECPMCVGANTTNITSTTLGNYLERTNKNIIPMD